MTDYKLEFKAAAARDLYKLTKQDKFLGKEIIDRHLPRTSPIHSARAERKRAIWLTSEAIILISKALRIGSSTASRRR